MRKLERGGLDPKLVTMHLLERNQARASLKKSNPKSLMIGVIDSSMVRILFLENLTEYRCRDAPPEQHVLAYIQKEAQGVEKMHYILANSIMKLSFERGESDRSPLPFGAAGVGSLDLELSDAEQNLQKQICFLLLWLARYVLPGAPDDGFSPTLVPLAIKLSNGTSFPLGPLYLDSLYKRLDLFHSKTKLSMGRYKLWSAVDVTFIQMCLWESCPRCAPRPNLYDSSAYSHNYRAWAWHKWQLGETSILDVLDKHVEFCARPYAKSLAGLGSPQEKLF
ncbi:hypothetical protein COLO4_06973 [Corchorus olitorius]|uniref:Aminotransferase-like plant mobile domain-containing protein n=1 Tax=Corchorus olitorius TaxID=93759 RepID=A0A1R3KLE4_9ROSI|nr:hypothetical protein COLO4_06973 [Corchorus olitorius]